MNSLPNVSELLKAPLGHPDVIGLLERVLADARAGRVLGVAVVVTGGPGNMNAMAAVPGGGHAELYMGCGAIQGVLLSSTQGRPASGIVRPS